MVDNISDERAQIANNYVYNRDRITINRPRTIGLRANYTFRD